MNSVGVVSPFNGLCFPNKLSASSSPSFNLAISNFPTKEISDNAPYLTSRLVHLTARSIRYGGNRRGHHHSIAASGGTNKGNSPPTFDDESSSASNQDEIIAIFKRIQASIAKQGGSAKIGRGSSNTKESKAAESVLDVLLQSRKQMREENKVLSKRHGVPKAEGKPENTLPKAEGKPENTLPKAEVKLDAPQTPDIPLKRPPSNFVKKSPIRKQLAIEEPEPVAEVAIEESVVVTESQQTQLKGMKVVELKELAKSRGFKGYSKLNKGELVELLRGQ